MASNLFGKTGIFQRLSAPVLEKINQKLVHETLEANQIIFQEGEYGHRLYLIEKGKVEISIENKQGEKIVLTTLSDGDAFGEMALLTDSPRSASATTLVTTRVLYLLKTDFNKLLFKEIELALALSRTLSQKLKITNQLLSSQAPKRQKNEKLSEFPEELQAVFKTKMTREVFQKGQTIFTEGDKGDRLYLIENGKICISVTNKEGEEVKLATLTQGTYFGEMAMISDTPRSATARACTNCTLYFLNKHDFNILLENRHALAVELSIELNKVLSKRLVETNKLISRKEENQVFLLISEPNHPNCKHFIEYLESITSKTVFVFNNPKRSDLILNANKLNSGYIVIIHPDPKNKYTDLATHVINFNIEIPDQIFISKNAEKSTIESLIRRLTNKTIGIALSSGTAPGLAHIGVMKVLLENNIPIDYIAGTSGGSLYGAGFAFGYNYKEVYNAFAKVYKKSLIKLFDPSFSKTGLFNGKTLLKKTIKKLIGNKNIEESIIPYAAVSSDLYTGEEQIVTEGNLIQAIRASLSIPILFTPVRKNKKLLVDGVVTTPIPVSALEKANIDIKLAVYVSELTPFEKKKPNMLSVFLRARNISADFIADEAAENANVIMKPNIDDLKQFEYNRIDEVIKAGEAAALKALPRIKRLFKR